MPHKIWSLKCSVDHFCKNDSSRPIHTNGAIIWDIFLTNYVKMRNVSPVDHIVVCIWKCCLCDVIVPCATKMASPWPGQREALSPTQWLFFISFVNYTFINEHIEVICGFIYRKWYLIWFYQVIFSYDRVKSWITDSFLFQI